MKKIILTLVAFCTATFSVMCFNACELLNLSETGTKSEYEPLNEMLGINYSKVSLTVTDTFGGNLSLVSRYIINYSDDGITINYNVERFTSLSLDGITDGAKTTLTGEAVIKDGDVIVTDGVAVIINADIAKYGMNFKEEYFTNADLTSLYLKADVKDASGFMRSDITCTDMKVEATFLEMFYNIKITYRAESGNLVELFYEFTL